MSERIKMIGAWLGGDYAVSELAAQYGVSRKTVYKWIERHEAGGWAALEDQSRAPRHHPNAVSGQVEQALLELKARRPLWGAEAAAQTGTGPGRGALPGRKHGERDPAPARVEPDRAASAPGGAQCATVRRVPGSQRGVVCGLQGLVSHRQWRQVHATDDQ